jgi:membrane fusion protein (multidrug efflux system)
LIDRAPAAKQAGAKLLQAQRELEQAELALRDCNIVSAAQGVVTSRAVNPGNNVQTAQSLITVSSLTDIWIAATVQSAERERLHVGDSVRCEIDTPTGRREFQGHVTGWNGGAAPSSGNDSDHGLSEAPRDLTRWTVRIDLDDYEQGTNPLFVGLPVVIRVPQLETSSPARNREASRDVAH